MSDLRPEHKAILDAATIAPEVYTAAGVRSAEPEQHGRKSGIIFPYKDRTAKVVNQFRPDKPDLDDDGEPVKYLWPTGEPSILNLIRERGTGPIILCEGTKQALAVASHAPDLYSVYGMAGCWTWTDTDFSWLKGREVYVIFDADLGSNLNVWTAAEKLRATLKVEDSDVKFVILPTYGTGGEKAGIDDLLARRGEKDYAEYLERLLEQATTKLPKKPAAKRETTGPDLFFGRDGLLAEDLTVSILEERPAALTAGNQLVVYSGGVYSPDPAQLTATLPDKLGNRYRADHDRTVIRFATNMLVDRGHYLPETIDEPLLNVRNGLLHLPTGELREHTPAFPSTVQLPIDWDGAATCPTYEQWAESVIGEQLEDLEEVASTMLDPTKVPQKAALLFGVSRSGKGTFLRLMQAMAGRDNFSSVSLQELDRDQFAAAEVYRKILNCNGDLSSEHVRDLSLFKMMTGEDPISANKKYGSKFQYFNRALFAFAANEIPTVGESSRAYVNRMKPFHFRRSFAGAEKPEIEAAMKRELPGILRRWVAAWQQMKARGSYAETPSGVMQTFETGSDRVLLFLEDKYCIVTMHKGRSVVDGMTLDACVTPTILHWDFSRWAEDGNGKPMGKHKLADRVRHIPGVLDVRNSKGVRGFNLEEKNEGVN